MKIEIPVSVGEFLDKQSILYIKMKRVADKEKQKDIRKEVELLDEVEQKVFDKNDQKVCFHYFKRLLRVNEKLWDIENEIRIAHRNKRFGKEFIQIAKQVYLLNQQRSDLKAEINEAFNSDIKEVKSYESTD